MSWLISILLAGAISATSGTFTNSYEVKPAAERTGTTAKNTSDETEKFEKTYQFNPNGKIEVSNLNGSIFIEAWDRNEIYLEAVKVADRQERLEDVQIKIEDTAGNFKVRADYKPQNYKSGESYYKNSTLYVTFRLKVPRTAILNQIETVNGSVEVSNMTNYTEVSAVNGQVKATNLRGTAKLSTVNGTVYADFDELNDNSSISLGTVNGTVKLSIPSTANATIKAGSVNGNISNDFNLPVKKGKYVGRDLYGRIGSGNVKIKLSSVNGGLSISNKDGGTTNPAINLLQQKTSDEFDDSFDVDLDTSKINIDIENVVKETTQAVTISQKEVSASLKKAGAELAKINAEDAIINAEELRIAAEELDRKGLIDQNPDELAEVSEALFISRRSPYVQEKSGSFEVRGIPNLIIDAENCNVSVRSWDKSEIKYTISRVARTGVENEQIGTQVSNSKSEVKIKVGYQSTDTNLSDQVRIEVFVPKKSNLRIKSNKEIRLNGVTGEMNLSGGEGSINISEANGNLNVESSEGKIRIIGFDGELKTKSAEGDIYLEGNFSNVNSASLEGNIYLTLPDNADVSLTTNGAVDFGDLKLKTVTDAKNGKGKTLQIGNGGTTKYIFELGEGKLILRSKKSLIEI